ncbi:rod shape-determining protein MreD [bacterium]|nr:rod shape-determining protein MreD [bacterium]
MRQRANQPQSLWVIAVSFFVAYLLAAVPLPHVIALGRPDWVALFLIFWVLAVPERVGVFIGFCVGVLQDVVMGTYLGTYALAYAALAYVVLVLHLRLRMYPLLQQAVIVFMVVALSQILVQWSKGFFSSGLDSDIHLLPAVISAVFWPWTYILLRSVQVQFRVQ